MRYRAPFLIAISFCLAALATAGAGPSADGRFDGLTVPDPEWRLSTRPERPENLEAFEARRASWRAFQAEHGDWKVYVDPRTGVPLLAEGVGIPLGTTDPGQSVMALLSARALAFVADQRDVFGVDPAELVLDANSGSPDGEHWQLVFHREVEGIPVEGESLLFFVNFGRLVSFGATRWGTIGAVPEIKYTEQSARERLYRHMRLDPDDRPEDQQTPRLVFVAAPPPGEQGHYAGRVGEGVRYHLAWRFLVQVSPESGIWSAAVDVSNGEVISFYNTVVSAQVKGGVYGFSNDDNCPDGCELPDLPMPYADVTPIRESTLYANDFGLFSCSSSSPIATELAGDHNPSTAAETVVVVDNCPGEIGRAPGDDDCSSGIDLGSDTGTDCDPAVARAAARTSYYHGNRILEKTRGWWPTSPWAEDLKLDVYVNLAPRCNGLSSHPTEIFLYESTDDCRNTGEVPGLIHHEAGHAIDKQDDGSADQPSEGTADVFAMLQGRTSCLFQGLLKTGMCHDRWNYGYDCTECTGGRELDTSKRIPEDPATATWLEEHLDDPGGYVTPCGFQSHWEGHIVAEAVYELATRDLPAMGMDEDSAWQLAEKLFYRTRGPHSNQNTYSCEEISDDVWETSGCLSTSWYTRFRTIDDDGDGVANGTPHAAAIYAAFARHGIACGEVEDQANQNQSACSSDLDAPVLTVARDCDSQSRTLEWTAVPDTTEYLVMRNDLGCGYSFNIIARTSDTSFVDEGVPDDLEVFYRVQAVTTISSSIEFCPEPLEFDCGSSDCQPEDCSDCPRVPAGLRYCVERLSGDELTCGLSQALYVETRDCAPTDPEPPVPFCSSSTSKMICAPTELCESPVSNCGRSSGLQSCPAPVQQALVCGEGCQTTMPYVYCPETPVGENSCLDDYGDTNCCPAGSALYVKTCQCEAIGVKPPSGGPVQICPTSVSTMICR